MGKKKKKTTKEKQKYVHKHRYNSFRYVYIFVCYVITSLSFWHLIFVLHELVKHFYQRGLRRHVSVSFPSNPEPALGVLRGFAAMRFLTTYDPSY